jgi:ubiquinone/menaquinone biosynthesis C-methylase UbiE
MEQITNSSQFEQESIWRASTYLDNVNELNRLETSLKLLPTDIETLLDVGCGNGAFLYLIEKQKRLHSVGLEKSETAIKMALTKSNIIKGSIKNIPYEENSFDIVSSLEVLEHLPIKSFETAISELQRVAKNYLLISVPYKEKL